MSHEICFIDDTTCPNCDADAGRVDVLARSAIDDPTLKGNARTFAMPYLLGLRSCRTVDDYYGMDSARGMLAYALANLTGWRGDSARAWKDSARRLLKGGER